MESIQHLISNYVIAKDKNKPYLMKASFTESALLEMEVNTDNISFPATTYGLEAITDLLVVNFNQKFKNISTFVFLINQKRN